MNWESLDFKGITAFDRSIHKMLGVFLEDKEGDLGSTIVRLIEKNVHNLKTLSLHEALDRLDKYLQSNDLNINFEQFKSIESHLNKAIWRYVEILEGSVVELFQQLDAAGLEKWQKSFFKEIRAIKNILLTRMEVLNRGLIRIKELLQNILDQVVKNKNFLLKVFYKLPWKIGPDRQINLNLEKSKKVLLFRYKKFMDRYNDFTKIEQKTNKSAQKLENYRCLNGLDEDEKKQFCDLYKLLKIWNFNRDEKVIPEKDFALILRERKVQNKSYRVFEDYTNALEEILFHQSRLLKVGPSEFWQELSSKNMAIKVIERYKQEANTLAVTTQRFRDFLLRTDPNPYVRSRMGFSEWTVGDEPKNVEKFLQLSYKIEYLTNLYDRLIKAVQEGECHEEEMYLQDSIEKLNQYLHEMIQPLTSKNLMQNYAEKIVGGLFHLNELGSFNRSVTIQIGETLSKALRADWKYNVLFDIPQFQEVYKIHKGMVGQNLDRQHFNRISQVRHVFRQIEGYVQAGTLEGHLHQVEEALSDLKGVLQEFLNAVKRFNYPKEELEMQLLEYRYALGEFLHNIAKDNQTTKLFRDQFLFFNQYLEAVENR